jgi:branched-chain amino acid transport system substrate-binding protein
MANSRRASVSPGGFPRRSLPSARRIIVGFLIATLVAAVAACSSSSGTSLPSGSGASQSHLTGSPVKVLTFATLSGSLPTNPAMSEAAVLYGKWINDHGGINGHPLQVIVCDEKGSPTAGAACAREAVQDKVVAVVGSSSYSGDAIDPILQRAGIAILGNCCPNTPSDLTNPDSFPVGNGVTFGPSLVARAVQDGHKKISFVVQDGAQPFAQIAQKALETLGQRVHSMVVIPAAIQDYSTQVAQATRGGTDAIIFFASEGPIMAFMGPLAQSGSHPQLYGPSGALTPAISKDYGSLTNGAVLSDSYADLSSPAFSSFRAAIADTSYGAPSLDYNGFAGLGTWAAYSAFTQIAKKVPGTLDASSFLKACNEASTVSTGGMTPVLDFTKPWTNGPPGLTRLFNRSAMFDKMESGKLVPLTTTFTDYTNLILGQKT